MHPLTQAFTELALLIIENMDFHYIVSLSAAILATSMLIHYVDTIGSTTQSLSSPYPSDTIKHRYLSL